MNDNFFHSLNSINLKARSIIRLHKKHIKKLNFSEYMYIQYLLYIINYKLYNYKLLYNLKWNIIFVDDVFKIENNFPHTMNDTIYIPKQYFFALSFLRQISILIHEKIHIYQRFYPIQYHKILKHLGIHVKSFLPYHNDYANHRRNPDLNNILYHVNNSFNIQSFNKNPKSLSDSYMKQYNISKSIKSNNFFNYEHANEYIAYSLTTNILNNNVIDNIAKYL
jgi:hypothetical protein